ncbi:D-isomer specific 2-hydroxyacid dehydrogenase [Suillus bovinus]|uniref:D-isomer specific 2-hydroxyacid dehydrogenase n=1 Tax=Suillus bovinus TaxID=48563 RepID=UPI001B866D8E|nr:D-isomer specific 2-hydroxyacid dehydrogenase [Suillus bovinus]KAG2159114.1 D-isomer specific 2-hydroxyacid dehydrogenase [Suillus bovinus]
MLPRVLLCDEIEYVQEELKEMFHGIAEVVHLVSESRSHFLSSFGPGGPYEGTVALYRLSESSKVIGKFDEPLIRALADTSMVRWIAQSSSGYDEIDVQACKERGKFLSQNQLLLTRMLVPGILVSNTPGANEDATASTALYLMLSCLRHFSMVERSLRSGTWRTPYNAAQTHDATGRTLGILGLGYIGLRFAHLVHAFPMRVIYFSRTKAESVPDWCEYVSSIEELCEQADILSLHVPLNQSTAGMVGEKEIRTLRRGSVLLNTSRGRIVDQEAMIRALEDGHLSSVGLDVYPDEPRVDPRLLTFPRCTLLPHIGGQSAESDRRRELQALGNVKAFVLGGVGEDIVPELRTEIGKSTTL